MTYNYLPQGLIEEEARELVEFLYDYLPWGHVGQIGYLLDGATQEWVKVYGGYLEVKNYYGEVLLVKHWRGYMHKMWRQLNHVGAIDRYSQLSWRKAMPRPENLLERVSVTDTLKLVEAKLQSGELEEAECLLHQIK